MQLHCRLTDAAIEMGTRCALHRHKVHTSILCRSFVLNKHIHAVIFVCNYLCGTVNNSSTGCCLPLKVSRSSTADRVTRHLENATFYTLFGLKKLQQPRRESA